MRRWLLTSLDQHCCRRWNWLLNQRQEDQAQAPRAHNLQRNHTDAFLEGPASLPGPLTWDDMALVKRRKVRTFALLFCLATFTTVLFSYTLRDPSVYFFKFAFRLSDNLFARGLCACGQCMTEVEDDPWFTDRFNQSIHPLMSRENSALSDETFKWWQVRGSSRQTGKEILEYFLTEADRECCWEQRRCWEAIINKELTLISCILKVFVCASLSNIQGFLTRIKYWGRLPRSLFTFNKQDGDYFCSRSPQKWDFFFFHSDVRELKSAVNTKMFVNNLFFIWSAGLNLKEQLKSSLNIKTKIQLWCIFKVKYILRQSFLPFFCSKTDKIMEKIVARYLCTNKLIQVHFENMRQEYTTDANVHSSLITTNGENNQTHKTLRLNMSHCLGVFCMSTECCMWCIYARALGILRNTVVVVYSSLDVLDHKHWSIHQLYSFSFCLNLFSAGTIKTHQTQPWIQTYWLFKCFIDIMGSQFTSSCLSAVIHSHPVDVALHFL